MRTSSVLVPLLVVGMVGCSDSSWFERDWISDANASFAANPQFLQLDADQQAEARNMFGRMRWKVSDGAISSSVEGSDPLVGQFSIESEEVDRLQLLIEEVGIKTRFRIQRSDSGFCVRSSVWSDEYPRWSDATIIECFRPNDA